MNLHNNRIRDDLQRVVGLIQHGELHKAFNALQMILRVEKKNPDVYHLLGIIENISGNKKDAVRFIKKAIKINPKIGIYHRNLGLIYHDIKRNKNAIYELRKSISLDPDNSQSYCDLGAIYSKIGRTNDAIEQYKRSISKDGRNIISIVNMANTLRDAGRHDDAIEYYKRAIEIDSAYVPAYFGLGGVYEALNNLPEAFKFYNKALDIDGTFADAIYSMGNVKAKLGKINEAIDLYIQATEINNRHYQAYNALGNSYNEIGQLNDAINSYELSISVSTNNDKAYNGLGNVLSDLGELDSAARSYKKAIDINPYNSDAYNGLGNMHRDIGDFVESVRYYRKSIDINSDNANVHTNLSHVLLMLGDFCNGWKEYEWGLLDGRHRRRSEFNQLVMPKWQGENLENKTILVVAEQGVGDEIMFSSCLPDLMRENPGEIILECDPRLESIFSRSFTSIKPYGERKKKSYDWLAGIGDIDYYIPIGSLPGFFRKGLDDFPNTTSYLNVGHGLRRKWRQRYASIDDRMKIGLSWKGGSNMKTKNSRSIKVKSLLKIVKKEASFINLQYGDCCDEISYIYEKSGIVINDWDDLDPLVNLDDFIAAISELDLVISIDNSTVHMAGAIGVPTWVLVPYVPDWRWMLDSKNSPWYREVSLFRQKYLGDWDDVIKRVSIELDGVIEKD